MATLVVWPLFWGINASLMAFPSPSQLPPNVPRRLQKRQTTASMETCGYANGNELLPRMAAPGYSCGEDIANTLWGFYPDTVAVVADYLGIVWTLDHVLPVAEFLV